MSVLSLYNLKKKAAVCKQRIYYADDEICHAHYAHLSVHVKNKVYFGLKSIFFPFYNPLGKKII